MSLQSARHCSTRSGVSPASDERRARGRRAGPLRRARRSRARLLERAYEVARAGTLAEDAILTIEESPVRVYCPRCGNESEATPQRLLCGSCGDWRTEVVSGDELLLMSVELVSPDGARPESRI